MSIRIERDGCQFRYTVYDANGAIIVITKFRKMAEQAIKNGLI